MGCALAGGSASSAERSARPEGVFRFRAIAGRSVGGRTAGDPDAAAELRGPRDDEGIEKRPRRAGVANPPRGPAMLPARARRMKPRLPLALAVLGCVSCGTT